MNMDSYESFINLVRLGIGHSANAISGTVDWSEVKAFAERQGLSAVVLDGIEALRSQDPSTVSLPERQMLTHWIGEVLQGYEFRYELYANTIGEMAKFYNGHGFRMMVLKGYACSLDWPTPEHRPTGDIDIWLFGRQKEADATLAAERGVAIDNSHHHHTLFPWNDFMVENHYDFINIYHHKSHVEFEKILKEFGGEDSYYTELLGERVWLPSPNLHALFLMKHLMLHFSSGVVNFRQLLDWGFFVRRHGKEVDWERIDSVFEKFRMKELYGIFNAICVEDLGFDASAFSFVNSDTLLKQRVVNDIRCPRFAGEMPSAFFPRLAFKLRRWHANIWKHKLCYRDSLWSAFWYGLWGHLIRPGSL